VKLGYIKIVTDRAGNNLSARRLVYPNCNTI